MHQEQEKWQKRGTCKKKKNDDDEKHYCIIAAGVY